MFFRLGFRAASARRPGLGAPQPKPCRAAADLGIPDPETLCFRGARRWFQNPTRSKPKNRHPTRTQNPSPPPETQHPLGPRFRPRLDRSASANASGSGSEPPARRGGCTLRRPWTRTTRTRRRHRRGRCRRRRARTPASGARTRSARCPRPCCGTGVAPRRSKRRGRGARPPAARPRAPSRSGAHPRQRDANERPASCRQRIRSSTQSPRSPPSFPRPAPADGRMIIGWVPHGG